MILLSLNLEAQDNKILKWNNKQCAVVLTYDDGLNVHLDKVIPALDSAGMKATFYIPGNSSSLSKRMAEWKAVAANGHELGNHTLFHPCAGKSKKRDWVAAEYDLDGYSIKRMVQEIRLANTMLNAIDGKTMRTFAYTCGDRNAGDSSFVDSIQHDFIAGRGVKEEMNLANKVDLFDIGAFMINGQTGDELIDLVKRAKKDSALLVFLFHGVGGEHHLNVSLEAHNQLLRYLKKNEADIWIVPLAEISAFIRESQKNSLKK